MNRGGPQNIGVMEKLTKKERVKRGWCPVEQRALPSITSSHSWHSSLTQACTGCPHHSFCLLLFSPNIASPTPSVSVISFCRRAALHVRGCSPWHMCTYTQAFTVCKGCSGRQQAKWPSVTGALVMCWWYSLWGMWRREFPSQEWGVADSLCWIWAWMETFRNPCGPVSCTFMIQSAYEQVLKRLYFHNTVVCKEFGSLLMKLSLPKLTYHSKGGYNP